MTETEFGEKLDKVDAACEKLVQKLANEVRRTIVIPICKKRKLRFTSGMGMFSFSDADNDSVYDYDASDRGWGDVVGAYRVLSAQTALHNHSIGDYVRDVKLGGGR